MRHIILLLSLFIFTSQAFAQATQQAPTGTTNPDMSVFGITLGQRFDIPECTKRKIGGSFMYSVPKTVCFERLSGREGQTGEITNDTVLVKFPFSEAPQISTTGNLMIGVIDGKLESVGFNTAGVRFQEYALAKLIEKYGKPHTLIPHKLKTRIGATFDTFVASWSFPNLFVTFDSVSFKLDSGLVNIDTKKGKEDRERALKELLKDKRPL